MGTARLWPADRKSVAKYVERLIVRDVNKARDHRPNGHLQ
jgi:hypothetical protein